MKTRRRYFFNKKNSAITLTFNITSVTSSTQILGFNVTEEALDLSQINYLIIDGKTIISPTYNYTFSTTGKHTVKIIFKENVTNMYSFVRKCNELIKVDMREFNGSNVTNYRAAFMDCKSLEKILFGNLNTDKVTTFAYCFQNASKLTSLDLSKFNTSQVTDLDHTFYNCARLTYLNVSTWDVRKVVKFSSVFHTCEHLTSLDVSNWVTSSATNFWAIFNGCANLTKLDVSKFDTSKANYINYMFRDCPKLTEIKMLGPTSTKTETSYMFENVGNNGVFRYNSAYNYTHIINQLPSNWTAVAN